MKNQSGKLQEKEEIGRNMDQDDLLPEGAEDLPRDFPIPMKADLWLFSMMNRKNHLVYPSLASN